MHSSRLISIALWLVLGLKTTSIAAQEAMIPDQSGLRFVMGECSTILGGPFRQVYGVLDPRADPGQRDFAFRVLLAGARFAHDRCHPEMGYANIIIDIAYGDPETLTEAAYGFGDGRRNQYNLIATAFPRRAIHARNYKVELTEIEWNEMEYNGVENLANRARQQKGDQLANAAKALVPYALKATGDLDYLIAQTKCLGPRSYVRTLAAEECSLSVREIRMILANDYWAFFNQGAAVTPLERQMREGSMEVQKWRDSLVAIRRRWEGLWWRASLSRQPEQLAYDLTSKTFRLGITPMTWRDGAGGLHSEYYYEFSPAISKLQIPVGDLKQAYLIDQYAKKCKFVAYALSRLVRPGETAPTRRHIRKDGDQEVLVVRPEAIVVTGAYCLPEIDYPLMFVVPVMSDGKLGPPSIGERFRVSK